MSGISELKNLTESDLDIVGIYKEIDQFSKSWQNSGRNNHFEQNGAELYIFGIVEIYKEIERFWKLRENAGRNNHLEQNGATR